MDRKKEKMQIGKTLQNSGNKKKKLKKLNQMENYFNQFGKVKNTYKK